MLGNKNKNFLNIGDRVDLYLGEGPVYRSKVEDITNSGDFLVSIPTYKGEPIEVHKGQKFQIYFYRTNGRYRVDVRMAGYRREGSLQLLELEKMSEPQKQQRRESFRLPIDLKVTVTLLENDSISEDILSEMNFTEEISSLNISATGIAIKTKREYSIGDKVFLQIHLKWPNVNSKPLEIMGEVKQVELFEYTGKEYIVGISFLYVSNDIYNFISKFIMVQEQKRLRQKRLVEGD